MGLWFTHNLSFRFWTEFQLRGQFKSRVFPHLPAEHSRAADGAGKGSISSRHPHLNQKGL
jgi:hypothetical protein